MLDDISLACAAFNLRFALAPSPGPSGGHQALLVLVDAMRRQDDPSGAAQHSQSGLQHLQGSASVQARKAFITWARKQRCDVCFVYVHAGSEQGLQEYLASPQAQEQFMVVLSGNALTRFIPAFQSCPSLLTHSCLA